jgi:hypothetical protein
MDKAWSISTPKYSMVLAKFECLSKSWLAAKFLLERKLVML